MLRYDTELPTQRNSNIEGIQFHKEIVLKESVWEYLRLGRLITVYITNTRHWRTPTSLQLFHMMTLELLRLAWL